MQQKNIFLHINLPKKNMVEKNRNKRLSYKFFYLL